MLQRIRSRSVVMASMAAVVVQFLSVAPKAEAGYGPPPDLPGIDDSGVKTALLIGGVTLAAVGVIYLVSKGGKKDDLPVDESKRKASESADEIGATESEPRSETEPLSRVRALELPDLLPLIGIGDREVRVGFAATF